MERSGKERSRDRISELPESLIHHILSFLPIRDVVATTILSRSWKNLWITVPRLNFCELSKYYKGDAKKIRTFVDRSLLFWRRDANPKFKFDFNWKTYSSLPRDLDLWVRFAVENNIQELDIHLRIDSELENDLVPEYSDLCVYCAPLCLNSCSSITELSLVGCNIQIPVSPSWNQLKTLKLDGYWGFSESVINLIMLGSPQLEVFELRFVETDDNLNICSTSLNKLKIEKYSLNDEDFEPSKDKWLRICCPNLEMLAISGVLYSKYLFTNVSSVTDVTLGLNGTYDYPNGNELVEETMKQIFSTFQHVDKATLSYWCVQVLGVLSSSLPNVEFFPNLKMLVIKDQTRDTEYEFDAGKRRYQKFETKLFDASKYVKFERKLSKSFILQLKTVDITLVRRKSSTFRFIEFLLKDGCMLQKLVIWIMRHNYTDVAERLLYMPRSSPTARVFLNKY